MGNNRNLIVLALVLVVLVGAYVLTQDRRPDLDTTGGFVELVEGTLSTDDVYTLSLSKGDAEGITIVQRDGNWVVASHHDAPANLNKVRTVLGNLETVSGELRSEDASVLDAYALDDDSAYHLEILDEGGAPMAALLIGKRSGTGCFVREPGSDRVLLADHNFLSDFGLWAEDRPAPNADLWIDMAVVKLDREAVRNVELITDTGTLALTKEFVDLATAGEDSTETLPDDNAYEWRVTGPEEFVASKTRADGVLASMVSLRARGLVGDTVADEYGLGDDARRAVVTLEDGTSTTLRFGDATPDDESLLYFQVEGSPLVWTLPDYVAKNVFKSADDLKTES